MANQQQPAPVPWAATMPPGGVRRRAASADDGDESDPPEIELIERMNLLRHFESGAYRARVDGSAQSFCAVPLGRDDAIPDPPAISQMMAALGDRLVSVDLRADAMYSLPRGGLSQGPVLLSSESIEPFVPDPTNRKRIAEAFEVYADLARYICGQGRIREVLVPEALVLRRGRVAYFPGLWYDREWPRAAKAFFEPDSRPAATPTEQQVLENLRGVVEVLLFRKGIPRGYRPTDPGLREAHKRLRSAASLTEFEEHVVPRLRERLSAEPPPDLALGPERPARGLPMAVKVGLPIAGLAIAAGLKPVRNAALEAADAVRQRIGGIASPGGGGTPDPGNHPGIDDTAGGGGAPAGADGGPAPSPGPAGEKQFGPQCFILIFGNEKPNVAPESVAWGPKGDLVDKNKAWTTMPPEIKAYLIETFRRLARTDKVSVDAEGKWTIDASPLHLDAILKAFRNSPIGHSLGSGKSVFWIYPGPEYVVTRGAAMVYIGDKEGNEIPDFNYSFIPEKSVFRDEWVRLELTPDDQAANGAVPGAIDLTKVGVKQVIPANLDVLYQIRAVRQSGAVDVIKRVPLVCSKEDEIQQALGDFFKRLGMQPGDLKDFYKARPAGKSQVLYTTHLMHLINSVRLHFNVAQATEAASKQERDRRLNQAKAAYEEVAASAPATGSPPSN